MIADAPCDPYQSMNERGEQFFEGENVYKSSFRYLSSSIVQAGMLTCTIHKVQSTTFPRIFIYFPVTTRWITIKVRSYALNLLILYKLKRTKRTERSNLKEWCMQVLVLFQTCQKYNLFKCKNFVSSEVAVHWSGIEENYNGNASTIAMHVQNF